MFEVSNPGESRGNTITAREILDRGVERIGGQLEDQPRLRARMMGTMGRVYTGLGLLAEAEPLLDEAVGIHQRAGRELHVVVGLVAILEAAKDFQGFILGGRINDDRLEPSLQRDLADAQAAGAVTINYGVFINTVISFLIVAFVIFLLIRNVNRMRREEEAPPAEPTEKDCPYCLTKIPIKATRCPHCTSELATG